jgi:hypothetical protein
MLLTAVALVVAVVRRVPSVLQWVLIGLITAWALTPWVSLGLQQERWEPRYLAIGATTGGVALASTLAGAHLVRWILFTVGSLWVGASVLLGLIASSTSSRVLPGALDLDPSDRYTQWVRGLGLDVPAGSIQALVGLSQHRNLLGMLVAVVLVLQLRHVLSLGIRSISRYALLGLLAIGPGLSAIALLWTMSRTAILAAIAGVLASLIPIERVRDNRWLLAVGLGIVLLASAPLLMRDALDAVLAGGNLEWRVDVWQQFLAEPGIMSPLGLGPEVLSPKLAAHAHSQVLESLVVGGWVGVSLLVALTVVGAAAAARAAEFDSRAAFACIVTIAIVSQFEVLATPRRMLGLNPAAIIAIAVVVSAAGLVTARDRGQPATTAPPGLTRQGGWDERR